MTLKNKAKINDEKVAKAAALLAGGGACSL